MAIALIFILLLAITSPCSLSADSPPKAEPIAIATVCEVLTNPWLFNGKNLVLIGRSSYSIHGRSLSEDDCNPPVITAGHKWPNSIYLECCYKPAPNLPSGTLMLDRVRLAEKVKRLRQTTPLKVEKAFCLNPPRLCDARQQWGVAYGRLSTSGDLRPPSAGPDRDWGTGFGYLGVYPAELFIHDRNWKSFSDDDPPPAKLP